MARKLLGKFKTNRTMYLQYDYGFWECCKPDGKYLIDYCLLKYGSVLYAYELEEKEINEYDNYKIILLNKNKTKKVYFAELSDLYNCSLLDQIK